MKKIILSNGLTVIYEKRPIDSVTVNVTVKVGSNYEAADISGISHFTEHMLFDGTKTRTTLELSNTIESKGGIFNAATTNERTFYYVKILKKHFRLALDILSDMIINPLFDPQLIDKERNVILQEIDMVNDEPRFYQWVLFQKSLFSSTIKNPTYGSKDVVKSLQQKDFFDFHKKHYLPNNMIVSIVGNVSDVPRLVDTYFGNLSRSRLKTPMIKEPDTTPKKTGIEKKKLNQSYLIIGFKSPKRSDKLSLVLDLADAILARGQSGRLFDTLRNKHGLAYNLGIYHEPSLSYGFFAAYVSTSPEKLSFAHKLVLKEFDNLMNITDSELDQAKSFIEGNFKLENEDSANYAESLAYWDYIASLKDFTSYVSEIRSIKLSHFKKSIKKLFSQPYCNIKLLPKS